MALSKQPFTPLAPPPVDLHCLKERIVQGRAFPLLHTGVQGSRPVPSWTQLFAQPGLQYSPDRPSVPGLECCFIVETVVTDSSWGGSPALLLSCGLTCLWTCFPLKRKGSCFHFLGTEPSLKTFFFYYIGMFIICSYPIATIQKSMLEKELYVCSMQNVYVYYVHVYNMYTHVFHKQLSLHIHSYWSTKNEILPMKCNLFFLLTYRHLFICRSASFSRIFFIHIHLDLSQFLTDDHLEFPRLLILILVLQ